MLKFYFHNDMIVKIIQKYPFSVLCSVFPMVTNKTNKCFFIYKRGGIFRIIGKFWSSVKYKMEII